MAFQKNYFLERFFVYKPKLKLVAYSNMGLAQRVDMSTRFYTKRSSNIKIVKG